ncbi:hypothetical protein Mlg_0387 [Alkalilimnicola ehrlichii MLHE-1]|uniref:Uncharacterized protein n=1 Tax=Alkalilimnicola ehrlichii (strain ATCC BAA-1101 / DSM 17681 / MLHE-1) TaxID=187272 RepID=Q0ABP6_ALKEH|nr:hypothetical protein Mlg_0387 [Alkalilimnicola ehrlichii MLHE-1]
MLNKIGIGLWYAIIFYKVRIQLQQVTNSLISWQELVFNPEPPNFLLVFWYLTGSIEDNIPPKDRQKVRPSSSTFKYYKCQRTVKLFQLLFCEIQIFLNFDTYCFSA